MEGERLEEAILLALTIVGAVIVHLLLIWVGLKAAKVLDFISEAKGKRERGEWLVESILHLAYMKNGMRPGLIGWYLKVVIVLRTSWLMAAAVTLGNYVAKWSPEMVVLIYWVAAVTIIVLSVLKDSLRLKQWRSMLAGRYSWLQDLPFH